MKTKALFMIMTLALSAHSHAYSLRVQGTGFYAPAYQSRFDVIAPEAGSIIFKQDSGKFVGRNNATGWLELSSSSAYWRVEASISGANPTLGTSATQNEYAYIPNSSLTLSNSSGAEVVAAYITCASGEASSGATCSGSENVGISFVPGTAGPFRICASFAHLIYLNTTSSAVFETFRIGKTTDTSVSFDSGNAGKEKINSAFDGVVGQVVHPVKVCGRFTAADNTTRLVFRLFHENDRYGTVNNNQIEADVSGNHGERDVVWDVEPLGF